MKRQTRGLAWGLSATFLVAFTAGCTKTPPAAPPASVSDTQLTNSRIAAIQNDPRMSPADKERAINTLKARQSSSVGSSPR